jgi:hypothetical protein
VQKVRAAQRVGLVGAINKRTAGWSYSSSSQSSKTLLIRSMSYKKTVSFLSAFPIFVPSLSW